MSEASKPLDVKFAVFNRQREERQRTDEGFIRRFGREAFDKEIQPIHDEGIMTIFHKAPNEHTGWYVEIAAFLVNERISRIAVDSQWR